jgi:hypothetical protein
MRIEHTERVNKDRRESSETNPVSNSQRRWHHQGGVRLVFRLVEEAICDDGSWVIGRTRIIEGHV